MAILFAVALTFLRPQFLVYLALLLVFFVLKYIFPINRKERHNILRLLALLLVCWVGVLLYCNGLKKNFGIFSLSTALPRQNLKVCIDREYYLELDDSEIVQYITQNLNSQKDQWVVCMETIDKFGYLRIDQTTKHFITKNLGRFIKDTVLVMVDNIGDPFVGYSLRDKVLNANARGIFFKIYEVQMILFGNIPILYVMLASLLEGIAMIKTWISKRKLPWVHMALFSISICTTYLTFFVTCDEYMRTMISVIPYFYVMVAMFFQMCTNYSIRKFGSYETKS